MLDTILVANAGSSSIKFQLFDIVGDISGLDLSLKGQVEGIGSHPRLIARDRHGEIVAHETFAASDLPDARAALGQLGSWLRARQGGAFPVAVGPVSSMAARPTTRMWPSMMRCSPGWRF